MTGRNWGWVSCLVLLLGVVGANFVEAFPTRPFAPDLSGYAPIASPTFTGVAKFPDGSEAAPSIAFSNAPGMGWRKNAGFLSASVGGVQVLATDGGIFYFKGSLRELTGADLNLAPRLKLAGTVAEVADFVLSAGWGSTASVGTLTGDDNHLRFTVTSAGIGQAVSPTITYTFKNGSWTTAPFCQAKFENASTDGDLLASVATQTSTATTLVITWRNAVGPVATRTYTFTTLCTGI